MSTFAERLEERRHRDGIAHGGGYGVHESDAYMAGAAAALELAAERVAEKEHRRPKLKLTDEGWNGYCDSEDDCDALLRLLASSLRPTPLDERKT